MLLASLRKLFAAKAPARPAPERAQAAPFVWLNKQGVRSRDGFEVQSVSRFIIEYREGQSKVSVDVERGFYGGQSSVSIEPNAFEHWDSLSFTISPAEQNRMRANFRAGLMFMGVKLEE